MKSAYSCSEKGFTLIEILMALTIFSFGLLAIAGLQVSAIQSNSGANQKTAEALLAQGIMEDILSFPRDNSNSSSLDLDPSTATSQSWTQYPFDSDDNSYTLIAGGTYTAEVTVTPDTPVSDMTQIEVVLTENNGHSMSLTSFKRMN